MDWADVQAIDVPELVILSACGAARSPFRRGEDGVDHLGGAFLNAGARAVVLSHQDIEVESTVRMMGVFHTRLRAGDSPARALLEARRSLADDSGFDHPFFHSLIHVTGLGFEPLFDALAATPERSRSTPPWLLGIGLAAACGGALVLARRRPRTTT